LIKKALANTTDFDFIQIMNIEEIWEAEEYFDRNKVLQLREKYQNNDVYALL